MHTLTGSHVYSETGEDIGEVIDVVGRTGLEQDPHWIAVKTGWFSERLVPYDLIRERADQLVTPCSKDEVKHAPKVDVHLEPVGEDLDELRRYYGLDAVSA